MTASLGLEQQQQISGVRRSGRSGVAAPNKIPLAIGIEVAPAPEAEQVARIEVVVVILAILLGQGFQVGAPARKQRGTLAARAVRTDVLLPAEPGAYFPAPLPRRAV
jgi:hypothetical protein